jgi:hypothetical protein
MPHTYQRHVESASSAASPDSAENPLRGPLAWRSENMSKAIGVSLFALMLAGSAQAAQIGDVFYIAM